MAAVGGADAAEGRKVEASAGDLISLPRLKTLDDLE